MTYSEMLRTAVAHEKAGRWSAAKAAFVAASKMRPLRAASPSSMIRVGRPRKGVSSARAEAVGLRLGDVLEHRRRGVVRATCVYRGPEAFEYAGETYSSLSSAAQAAAQALGLTAKNWNGWKFWGLERTESPTFNAWPASRLSCEECGERADHEVDDGGPRCSKHMNAPEGGNGAS